MKKPLSNLLVVLLTLALAACSAPAVSMTPDAPETTVPVATDAPSATALPAVVTFADPVLEEMVRGAMGRPDGDIAVAEAEAVTRLNLGIESERMISSGAAIKDIAGLENFTNLEYLDLSFHEITDIAPLAALTRLTWLSLSGNPVADIAPLAGLTNLKGLTLSGCAAQDYTPLANLINLEYLKLDDSTIADVSPLASLTKLRHLYLGGSPVNNYLPLATLYPNLENKDFMVASTLQELGFVMNEETRQAVYESDTAYIVINHSKWGVPPWEWERNIIRMSAYLQDEYKTSVGFYGDIGAYVFLMDRDGETVMNYIYDSTTGEFGFGKGDRESTEQLVRTVFEVVEGEDVLLAPIRLLNDTLQNEFHMPAEVLFAMPYEPLTLKSLGFFPDEASAVYRYEWRDGWDVNIDVHRPELGEKDYDVLFFTPLSDEYRIVMTYRADERKIVVGADDNDMGGATFDYYVDTGEHVDGWCSNKDITVEEYFVNAFNDPGIDDVYSHSVDLMVNYLRDTFGLTIEELIALPAGDFK